MILRSRGSGLWGGPRAAIGPRRDGESRGHGAGQRFCALDGRRGAGNPHTTGPAAGLGGLGNLSLRCARLRLAARVRMRSRRAGTPHAECSTGPGPAWTRERRRAYRLSARASAPGSGPASPHPTVRTNPWNSSSSPRSPRAPRTRRSRSRACRPDPCDPAKAARSVGPRTTTRPNAGSPACAGSPTSTPTAPSCARRSPMPSRRASRPASSGIRSARTCGRSRRGARSTRPRTCRP